MQSNRLKCILTIHWGEVGLYASRYCAGAQQFLTSLGTEMGAISFTFNHRIYRRGEMRGGPIVDGYDQVLGRLRGHRSSTMEGRLL